MKEELFTKKALDRIKSPESLNDYICVSNPSVWLFMTAVVILLAGACIWGIFGNLETTIEMQATTQDGVVTCLVETGKMENITVGMEIKIGEITSVISAIEPVEGKNGSWKILAYAEVPDGIYTVKIITETIHPMQFVFN